MKYYKTQNCYKASNLCFDINKGEGHSYDWYEIAQTFGHRLVLNTYNYSPTTVRHVYKLRKLFNELGLEYDELEAPKGLQNLSVAINYYEKCIADLDAKIKNPRTKAELNMRRRLEIAECQQKIALISEYKRA